MSRGLVRPEGLPDTACPHFREEEIQPQLATGSSSGRPARIPHCLKHNTELDVHARDTTEECMKGEDHCPLDR